MQCDEQGRGTPRKGSVPHQQIGITRRQLMARVAHMVLTSHCPQVDVLDRLGGGPQGQSARAAGEGLDGRFTPRYLCHLQDSALAQWAKPGHPSWALVLGGCLL
jgi:hypothetical protein